MKALTISQPYASLIANGEKFVENRTWPTSYRGLLAIHAGKGQQYMTLGQMADNHLPAGKIVAVATLVNCVSLDLIKYNAPAAGIGGMKHESLGRRSYRELAVHKHTEGPYCWILFNVQKLPEPVPWRGAQGLWEVSTELELKLKQLVYPAYS